MLFFGCIRICSIREFNLMYNILKRRFIYPKYLSRTDREFLHPTNISLNEVYWPIYLTNAVNPLIVHSIYFFNKFLKNLARSLSLRCVFRRIVNEINKRPKPSENRIVYTPKNSLTLGMVPDNNVILFSIFIYIEFIK